MASVPNTVKAGPLKAVMAFALILIAAGAVRWGPSLPAPAPLDAGPLPRLSLMTYNLYGYRVIDPARVNALVETIRNAGADIIALQEVNTWFVDRLLSEEWVRHNYYALMIPSGMGPRGGLYTLSRYPVVRVMYQPLPGKSHRYMLVTHVQIGKLTLPVVNVHMESALDAAMIRSSQLRHVVDSLRDYPTAVIMGDFNFGDDEAVETIDGNDEYVDLWRTLRPYERGYTWNMNDNPLARINAFNGERSRRLDRILVKSRAWYPHSVSLIGERTVFFKNLESPPSDHYGLVGTVVLRR